MFLKTLQIKGFKSFADPATLQLEPGVTVVVGPNGSGKSNVVDAIGWVLGAQAPSAVRSQKMDDVIFAGAAQRQALGRAEVSLTIDNSDGLLPIEFNEVTITRLLFRNGDSEYSINGAPCRLLDIQELLSDTGVGRQQHVIISQGNIDAILNARPEDRRLVIEEAAGVLKYRRRKERAERRLQATETNLTRIQDLLREVRRQLRPLERQADAARRYGALKAEHDAIKLHVAGRDLDRMRTRLADSARQQQEWRAGEQSLVAALADADARLIAAEAELTAVGGRDVGDVLLRYETLRERSRGLVALLNERRRGLGVELDATVDATVIASLEGERAQLRADLEHITADGDAILVEDREITEAEQAVAIARSRFEAEWGQGVEAPSGEAAGIRGELAALRAAVDRTSADRDRLELRRGVLTAKVDRLAAELVNAEAELADTTAAEPDLARRVAETESSRLAAEDAQSAAEVAATDAESEHSAWTARAEALAQALDTARELAGVERLTELDGVLGTLLDLVDVDAGWESSFEAAAADALGAVVVADVAAGRAALAALTEGDHRGAVLALDAIRSTPVSPPVAGESVRRHVRPAPNAPAALDGLLDTLVGNAVVVDGSWERAVDTALAHPGTMVVTRDGDRFGSTGWRIGAASSGATGAALDEARARVVDTAAQRDAARLAVGQARAALAEARRSEQEAARARDAAASRLRALTDAVARLGADRDEATQEHEAIGAHLTELSERHVREQARVAELEERLPALEAAEAELTDKARR
ncbi:MAG: chromosome segregation SMC family protein, partial [Actinomycetes bacterium]